ncbi:MAG: short chain dehydrogenase [Cyclobacteriaceae bacterium]|nr:short chain dehydrogenase [Cyclobacteriaceae bacterium]
MRIIIVGSTGTIGSHVAAELEKRHEVIRASATRGPLKVNITLASSIRAMYRFVGRFDAVVCTAGTAYFGPFHAMKEKDFYTGIKSKMMGQINLVMLGKNKISDGGSFTLTTGILYRDPVRDGAVLSMVNNAIHGFVLGASIELKRGVRINAVAPGLAEASAAQLASFFPGHVPVPMWKIVQGYVKSVEGFDTGKVIDVLS